MHPAGCLGAVMGPLSQQPHFIQGLASTYSEEHITGVPKSHAVRNETKTEPDVHLAKRNETKPKWAKCPIRETETKHKTTPMPTSRNRNETQNKSDAHLVRNETKRNRNGRNWFRSAVSFYPFFFGFECHPLPEGPKALEEDWERSGSGAPDLPNG